MSTMLVWTSCGACWPHWPLHLQLHQRAHSGAGSTSIVRTVEAGDHVDAVVEHRRAAPAVGLGHVCQLGEGLLHRVVPVQRVHAQRVCVGDASNDVQAAPGRHHLAASAQVMLPGWLPLRSCRELPSTAAHCQDCECPGPACSLVSHLPGCKAPQQPQSRAHGRIAAAARRTDISDSWTGRSGPADQ